MMQPDSSSRRRFLAHVGLAAAGLSVGFRRRAAARRAGVASRIKLCLVGGSIGVRADQHEAIRLAAKHGFDAVEPQTGFLLRLDKAAMADLRAELAAAGLVWGQGGAPLNFGGGEDNFRRGLDALPRAAAALERAGVTRVGTWLSPCSGELTYVKNFRMHAKRLREAARVLGDRGLRLGLEYIGTHTLLIARRYPFIHTLAETLDLIAEVGEDNVGVVLDSWHWWQAGDTADQVRALPAARVVSIDLNDAPKGIPKRAQKDNERELPAATGVIDIKAFLSAVRATGFDGPARAEPFNRKLNQLDNDAACAATIRALRRAASLR